MVPKAQKEPSWIGGPTEGFGSNEDINNCSLEANTSFKRTQILVKAHFTLGVEAKGQKGI